MNTTLLMQFEAGSINASDFGHHQHVQVAFEMLRRHDFDLASRRYVDGIKALSQKFGAEDMFNLTITLAFLSLIAERMSHQPCDTFEQFTRTYPEVFSSSLLHRIYSKERLHSNVAKGIFLLPDMPNLRG